jgi:hypothetical protein
MMIEMSCLWRGGNASFGQDRPRETKELTTLLVPEVENALTGSAKLPLVRGGDEKTTGATTTLQ